MLTLTTLLESVRRGPKNLVRQVYVLHYTCPKTLGPVQSNAVIKTRKKNLKRYPCVTLNSSQSAGRRTFHRRVKSASLDYSCLIRSLRS